VSVSESIVNKERELIMQRTNVGMKAFATAACLAVIALAGCSSTPDAPAKVEEGTTGQTQNPNSGLGTGTTGAPPPVVSAGDVGSAGKTAGMDPALTDPRNPLSKRSIFYDYDSFVVKDDYKPLVEAHAAYLKKNPNARIVVEGNTDERGSREYNLALGQKRSESVKRVLSLLGVSDAQVQTVSFGEEKPRNASATESAYSENRRCDIRYVGE
jgi:peptidoglycan-associated lipoprotein